jgi:hypothetical protein
MSKTLIAALIVGRLVLVPGVAAASPGRPDTPLADAVGREAVRVAQAGKRAPMRAGLKWTGIGLIIGSGMPIVTAKLSDCFASEPTCRRGRHAFYGIGAAMAGTGIALLMVADTHRPALPSLSFDAERVAITQRITF